MSDNESITLWIEQLKAGDARAADRLWREFFQKLLRLACHKLGRTSRRVVDEEDVVAAALETVFRRAQAGEFPAIEDRHDLWKLLVAITERKACNQIRDQRRLKRGGGLVRGESALGIGKPTSSSAGFEMVAAPEATPEFAAEMKEAMARLLGMLDDEQRQVAILKLEGFSDREIAKRIDRSQPTVERRLRLIRTKWQGELT